MRIQAGRVALMLAAYIAGYGAIMLDGGRHASLAGLLEGTAGMTGAGILWLAGYAVITRRRKT